MWFSVCVCVYDSERERERACFFVVCVFVRLSVCVHESERVRECMYIMCDCMIHKLFVYVESEFARTCVLWMLMLLKLVCHWTLCVFYFECFLCTLPTCVKLDKLWIYATTEQNNCLSEPLKNYLNSLTARFLLCSLVNIMTPYANYESSLVSDLVRFALVQVLYKIIT